MALSLVTYPDWRLRVPCAAVQAVTEDIQALAQAMQAVMAAHSGIGLAAPQVGHPLRLVVMARLDGAPEAAQVLINPEILETSDTRVAAEEGCLSLPGGRATVSRPDAVRARWTDLAGAVHTADFTGLGARCLQHEHDHLVGRLILDHLAQDDRQAAIRAQRKAAAQAH